MDTKWKNRKKTISFLIFFLGVSITLGSAADLIGNKPSGVRIWQTDKLLEDDYQQNSRFRGYIADRLENLLIMATGGNGLDGFWGYRNGTYYSSSFSNDVFEDYGGTYSYMEPELTDFGSAESSIDFSESSPEILTGYLEGLEGMLEGAASFLEELEFTEGYDRDSLEAYRSLIQDYRNDIYDYIEDIRDYLEDMNTSSSYRLTENIEPLTEEQKKKIAEKYHERIKGDKNLLYTVAYEGQVLYSNSDLLPADGSMTAPEGYNFILYFDGEKVRILKDGKELNVYGDGYYREENDWYVPGYRNFQLDENTKKASVCIAAAKDPVLYMEGSYGSGGSTQYDNSLYWLNRNLLARRSVLISDFICLGIGILLLLLSFFCRKSRREAAAGIGRLQGKIWFEVKLLLMLFFLFALYMVFMVFVTNDYRYDWWTEFLYAYEYDYGFDATFNIGRQLFCSMPSLFWMLLFWGIYLIRNDLKHNKQIWRHSLTAKLYRTFSAKHLSQSLSRKMALRNAALFHSALLFGLLMIGGALLSSLPTYNRKFLVGVQLLMVLGTVFYLILQYLAGSKNMEIARNMEALSRRIQEIRNGNYTESGNDSAEAFSDHDLNDVMTQLEDIRHGMAAAVDEQMKSQRMKVELIANVSHDIKTPLTSIISYVEFLKQEEELPEHVKDYIRILDEKSQRLKNMVQDVFAVSKAASGELPMQMEALDFGKLLRQTMADMEEQINAGDVSFRTEIPDNPVMIMADGQRMYRVFQNLFQNAIKYSLAGSRVYVTLKSHGCLAVASVKNTSRLELEKGKDFAERFARGDQSRTDGGSGLGLSIAQSFTEACGGQFSWETDADLFVVKVSFQILEGSEVSVL